MADGDPVALSLVRRQVAEICAMAEAAMRRIDLAPAGTPVVLGGGVLKARDPLLLAEIDRQLALTAPGAFARVLDVPPIAGAALLGLDHVAAPAAARQRLRDRYKGLTAGKTAAGRRGHSLRRASSATRADPARRIPPNVSATATGSLLRRVRSPHKTGRGRSTCRTFHERREKRSSGARLT